MPLLEVQDLHVEFALQCATMQAVEGVLFTLDGSDGQVLPLASISAIASAGATIKTPSKLESESKSLSPDTMNSTLAASANASTLSSSGSRHTGCGSGGGSITSARCRNSANER